VTVVAVVEDNADNRLLLQAILDGLYDVHEYETAEAALEAFERAAPDVVLLDISLPGMSGVELVERLRADPALRHVPVIALTAHAMAGDRETYLAAGFDAYVTKPIVDEGVLLRTIARLAPRAE
jgi:two-component system cell cycle response regulator DivK